MFNYLRNIFRWIKLSSVGNNRIGRGVIVKIFSKPDCHLCDVAKKSLQRWQQKFGFELQEVNIVQDPTLMTKYKTRIPLVWINGHLAFKYHINEKSFILKLNQAVAKQKHIAASDMDI